MKGILALMSAGLIFSAPAFGEGLEQKAKAKKEILKEARQQRQVGGTVLRHKTVRFKDKKGNMAKQIKNIVVLIKTDKGGENLVVDLGDAENVPEIKNNRTKIQAKGRMVKIGSKEFFVAHSAVFDGRPRNLSRKKQAQMARDN